MLNPTIPLAIVNNLKGREQKFLTLAFAYAKSAVKGKSCVHLKAY